jgi:glutaredoxin
VKVIRWILGKIILLIDALTAPSPKHRAEENQQAVDLQTQSLKLYQYLACPFCVKTRRVIRKLGLNIEALDALRNDTHRSELIQQGGQAQVPCLKIIHENGSVEWMYESREIISYLETRFSHI